MAVQGKTRLVAIVDDDDSMRSALHGMLKSAGLPALALGSAKEFLKSGQQHHTACLITDIRMPGTSGLELQAKLNAEHCRIPTIFITAHGDAQIRMQALRAGAWSSWQNRLTMKACSRLFELLWRVVPDKEHPPGVKILTDGAGIMLSIRVSELNYDAILILEEPATQPTPAKQQGEAKVLTAN